MELGLVKRVEKTRLVFMPTVQKESKAVLQEDGSRTRSAANAVCPRGHTMQMYVMDVAYVWYRRGYLQIPSTNQLIQAGLLM
jgi:hypothetical protein